MHFVKRSARGLLIFITRLSFTLLLILGPAVMVFGTSAQIKKSLEESKVYDNAGTSIVENAAKDSADQPGSPFGHPAVQEAAKNALTPGFLQSTSEQILDSVYAWLQGKTSTPQFNIDVAPVKQKFIASVGEYAVARASQLPVCTPQQTSALGAQVDPLTIPCVPLGYNVESLRAEVAAEIDKQQGQQDNLLQQSTISPESLPKDESGQTPVQKLAQDSEQAPEIYPWVLLAPWLFGMLAALCGGLYLILSEDKRHALRSLAITLVILGAFAVAGMLITNYLFDSLERSDELVNVDANLKGPLIALIRSLSDAFNQKLVLFGLVYVAIGGVVFAGLHFTKPKPPGIDRSFLEDDKPPTKRATKKPKTTKK